MPRVARKKSDECMYHIMSRSISEIELFRCDEDKLMYLKLLKRYISKYHCKIYAYCLMSNHVHLFINPCGYDISSFMRSLNTAYVIYYNARYCRHGHLFQGRFASKIVDNDTYALTLSAYIHNNPKDLPEFLNREETYKYSSYGIYTGYKKNADEIVDSEFLLNIFSRDRRLAQEKYFLFTKSIKNSGAIKEIDDNITRAYMENEYRNEKQHVMRNRMPNDIIKRIGDLLGESLPDILKTKHSRVTSKVRAFTTYVLRVLCGFSYKSLCSFIGNMSMSGVSRLSNQGFKLFTTHVKFRNAFNSLT